MLYQEYHRPVNDLEWCYLHSYPAMGPLARANHTGSHGYGVTSEPNSGSGAGLNRTSVLNHDVPQFGCVQNEFDASPETKPYAAYGRRTDPLVSVDSIPMGSLASQERHYVTSDDTSSPRDYLMQSTSCGCMSTRSVRDGYDGTPLGRCHPPSGGYALLIHA